jgi:sigma-B regulation protein RsbU (phosphoserine phosphatase)
MGRYRLPAPPAQPHDRLATRVRSFFLRGWTGPVLLAGLVLWVLDLVGAPLPGPARVLGRIVLFAFGALFLARFGRVLAERLLWRIRSKLILSYMFIAVVPVVLVGLLFMLAGLLFSGLVGSYMVSIEIQRSVDALAGVAESTLVDLPEEAPAPAAVIARRIAPARRIHPDVKWILVRPGRKPEGALDLPRELPAWIRAPGFAGLVSTPRGDALRAVRVEGGAFLLLEAPVDAALFADFERRTGIRLLTIGGTVTQQSGELDIRIDGKSARVAGRRAEEEIGGMAFFATPERVSWEKGTRDSETLTFGYDPYGLVRRLSPGSLNMADLLVKAFMLVGVIFLVVYCVALVLGLLLVRSITRSIHALSVGTERLRAGDLSHRIPVKSRDQLGELAESFNTMSSGIQDLLRQQAEKERLEEELRIARQIQMSLLPEEGAVSLPGLRIAALCLPAAEVGGDYYDLIPLSDTRMGLLVADVSGKGTSAALYMAELKGLVLSLSGIYQSPAKLLVEANRILAANMDPRTFITMMYAVVDVHARLMRYARAGHNPLIHLEASTGRTRVLAPQGLGLGLDRGARFDEILEEAEVPLRPGDVFLFFTDGLSEAMNGRAELFGERRLRDALESGDDLESEELKERILSRIREFVGEAAQHDDMTMVILKVA